MVSYLAVTLLFLSFFSWFCLNSSSNTLYDILEVSRAASTNQIKKKYRELAKKFHPDKHVNRDDEIANSKFISISNAYEILSDPEKRREYDQTLIESGDSRINTQFRPDFAFKFFHRDTGRYQKEKEDNGDGTVFVFKTSNGEFYYRSTLHRDFESKFFSEAEDDFEYEIGISTRIYSFILYFAVQIVKLSWPYVLVSAIFIVFLCFPTTLNQPKKSVSPVMRTDLSSYYNSHDHILDEDTTQNDANGSRVGNLDVPTATAIRVQDINGPFATISSTVLSSISKTSTSATSNLTISPILCADTKKNVSEESDTTQSYNYISETIPSSDTVTPQKSCDEDSIPLPSQPALPAGFHCISEPSILVQPSRNQHNFPRTVQPPVASSSSFSRFSEEHPSDTPTKLALDSEDTEIITIKPSFRSMSATNITGYLNYGKPTIMSPSKVIEGKKSPEKKVSKVWPLRSFSIDTNIASAFSKKSSPPQKLTLTSSSQNSLTVAQIMKDHEFDPASVECKLNSTSIDNSIKSRRSVSPTASLSLSGTGKENSNLVKLRDNLSVLYKKYIVSIVSLNPKVSRILNDIKATFQSDPVVMLDCCEFPAHSHALWSDRQNIARDFSPTSSSMNKHISAPRRSSAPSIFTSSSRDNNLHTANFNALPSPQNKYGNPRRLHNMFNQFGAKLKSSPTTAKTFMKNILRTTSSGMNLSDTVEKSNEPVADEVASKLRSYFRSKNRKNSVDGRPSTDLLQPFEPSTVETPDAASAVSDFDDISSPYLNNQTNDVDHHVESDTRESSNSFPLAEDDVAVKLKRYFAKRGITCADSVEFDLEYSNNRINFNHNSEKYNGDEGFNYGSADSVKYTSENKAVPIAYRVDLFAVAKNGHKWCGYKYERIITKPGTLPEDSVSEEEYETNKDLICNWLRKVLCGELEWNDTEIEGRFGSLGYPIKEFHGLTEAIYHS